VGKTRLTREALAVVDQRGTLTRWAVATASARTLPLGAFAAMLGVVGLNPARLVRQASDALLAGAGGNHHQTQGRGAAELAAWAATWMLVALRRCMPAGAGSWEKDPAPA
jgi:hypothetical protein